MESITHYVRDINSQDRQALEHLVGRPLRENQQIIIGVVTSEPPTETSTPTSKELVLPEWCNVYADLSDEEINRLDNATRQRLDLTRSVE